MKNKEPNYKNIILKFTKSRIRNRTIHLIKTTNYLNRLNKKITDKGYLTPKEVLKCLDTYDIVTLHRILYKREKLYEETLKKFNKKETFFEKIKKLLGYIYDRNKNIVS